MGEVDVKDLIEGIRRKRRRLNAGYVYAPYIISQISATISTTFILSNKVSSKYYKRL